MASVGHSRRVRAQLSDLGLAAGRDHEPVAVAHLAAKEEGSGLVACVPEAPERTS